MDIKKIEYRYAKTNLLEKPENYFFSEYDGNNFIKAYFQNRLYIIKKLKYSDNIITYNSIQEYLEKNRQNYSANMENTIISVMFLRDLLKEIINNNINDKKGYLDILLKKYEVTKKIFNEYDENFKAISNDYSNIESYCLLSICCSLYYKKSNNLKYINTSIKINDMLCSKGIIIEKNNIFLASCALNEEMECINKLFLEEGVSNDIN